MDGFEALVPNGELEGAAPPPPKSPPGLLAPAAPPNGFAEPVLVALPPPKRPAPDVLAPVLLPPAVPKMEGLLDADELLTAPKSGLLGVSLLPCCPKLNDMMRSRCGCRGLVRCRCYGRELFSLRDVETETETRSAIGTRQRARVVVQ